MNYTSIPQSKYLLELGLDANSADFYYGNGESDNLHFNNGEHDEDDIPCWSVGALLTLMPTIQIEYNTDEIRLLRPSLVKTKNGWGVWYDLKYLSDSCLKNYGSIIDACYNRIVWLLENGYIKKGE